MLNTRHTQAALKTESAKRHTVLILDDCQELLELVAMFLDLYLNCEVVTCSSFEKLLSHKAQIEDCAFAILDINLGAHSPNGIDAYHWLRENGFRGKAVFLTGHVMGTPTFHQASELAGLNVYSKPVPPSKIEEIVREHLGITAN